nr:leukotriene B4 receptor 1-like isoform X1 [Paramormyrops kingsleyae]XP_023695287.1 leukotriene B4 receptor 1-like isoform X1 [Paramormyrops kingsleyae]
MKHVRQRSNRNQPDLSHLNKLRHSTIHLSLSGSLKEVRLQGNLKTKALHSLGCCDRTSMAQNDVAFSSSLLSSSIHNATGGQNILGNVPTALGALILVLAFLLGCPGNLFIIWSILARSQKQSVPTLLFLHLACADGFLMALTPFFAVYLAKRSWEFGNIMCKGLFYLCSTNMYASILLISLMSLYRLVAVMWPQRLRAVTGWRTVLWVLAGLWMLVLVLSSPVLIFRQNSETEENGTRRTVCTTNHTLPQHVIFHYTLETLLGFLLPYGVIVTSYVCILRRIRQTRFRRKIRSERLILAIVVIFAIFWLPYHIINVVQIAAVLCPVSSPLKARLDDIWQSSRTVTSALAFISSCVNPVLYLIAGKAYIQKAGLAFMVRLFESTDSSIKGGRKISQDTQEQGRDGQSLKEVECFGQYKCDA